MYITKLIFVCLCNLKKKYNPIIGIVTGTSIQSKISKIGKHNLDIFDFIYATIC